jgi:hypothetical protein
MRGQSRVAPHPRQLRAWKVGMIGMILHERNIMQAIHMVLKEYSYSDLDRNISKV